MKKILLSVIGTGLFAFPLMSSANGVLCSIDVALNPVVVFGGATTFQATCTNNTSNRNYTDFSVINPSSSVSVTSSCGSYLPVGGSCVISGVFTPTSASDNSFTLGLNYGGTVYPSYPSLSFSTTVSTLSFTSTTGPNGADFILGAYAKVPDASGNYYILGTNNDVGQSDIYFFNGTAFVATNFPLSAIGATNFASTRIMAADAEAKLYVGVSTNGSITSADVVYKYDPTNTTQPWTDTNFISSTMGTAVIDLTINKDNRVFATTAGGAQVWEYDSSGATWVNTGIPVTLATCSLNQKTFYLIPDKSNGVLYGTTGATVYSFTPSSSAGSGVWFDTVTPVASIVSLFVDDSDILYAGSTAGGGYNIYSYTPTVPPGTTWVDTTFNTDTGGLTAPLYPSFFDTGSGILTYGMAQPANVLQNWILTPPNTWTATNLFPATETTISYQAKASDDTVYANSFNLTLGRVLVWQFEPATKNWLTLNFPTTVNKTTANLMTVNGDDDLFAVMLNGSYIKPAGSGTWAESNSGLFALTSHFQEILNGSLFTLNGRQVTSPSCSDSSGDPNSVYDPDWSDFPSNGGFIDIFQYPLAGPWASTGFPNTVGPTYLFTPLASNENTIYGLVFTSPGPNDIYRYTTSWTSTSFPSGPTVYACMQGALVTDPSNNLYVVTYSGTTYTIRKFTAATSTWSSTTGIPAATLVRQLKVDANGTPWAIVGTDVYTYNGTSWVTTSFPVLAGAPKHLSNDSANNIYAVTNSVQVWKYTAATATWGSAMLGGTGIPASAGKIYQQLRTDSANNLYARTRNTTSDVDSVWKYTAATDTWSDLSALTGFPTGAIIQDLSIDANGNVFISTSLGLYVYSGYSWFQLSTLWTDRLLVNAAGNYYQVTNNQGVFLGSLT